jgi:hypothetical protein
MASAVFFLDLKGKVRSRDVASAEGNVLIDDRPYLHGITEGHTYVRSRKVSNTTERS